MTRVVGQFHNVPAVEGEVTYQAAEELLRGLAGALEGVDPAPPKTAVLPPQNCGRRSTDLQPVEAKLRLAEARYRTLIEQLPVVTFLAALDGGVNELYVSPQIESLLGFSQKEWLENPVLWYNQLHPEDRERWHTEFARPAPPASASDPNTALWRATVGLFGFTARPNW